MALISDEVGVGRRTVFRYFASKHDIPWGGFDDELPRLAALLYAQKSDLSAQDAVFNAVTEFNVAASRAPMHSARMRLIMGEPSLQSHSVEWYAQWRSVIIGFVAEREGLAAHHPWPRLVAYATNAVAIAAYTEWLTDPTRSIRDSFEHARQLLNVYANPTQR